MTFAFLKNVHYNSSILKLEQEYFQVKVEYAITLFLDEQDLPNDPEFYELIFKAVNEEIYGRYKKIIFFFGRC